MKEYLKEFFSETILRVNSMGIHGRMPKDNTVEFFEISVNEFLGEFQEEFMKASLREIWKTRGILRETAGDIQ